jgi:parallel beta-helix repeat protein
MSARTEMSIRRGWAALLVGLLALSVLAGALAAPSDSDSVGSVPSVKSLAPHAPIRIDSNADFDAAHGVSGGAGTAGNPWVIENLDINGSGAGDCLYIGNTTENVVIRNCTLHHASGAWDWPVNMSNGINLFNVNNCIVHNNTLFSNAEGGVCYTTGQHSKIQNNTIYNNNWEGAWFDGIADTMVANNTIVSNYSWGTNIYMSDCWRIVYKNNILVRGGFFIMGDLNNWNTHDLDDTNKVNGKSVIYIKNQSNGAAPANAGQIILANCTNFVVNDQRLNASTAGILVGHSKVITIRNNVISNCSYGAFIEHSTFIDIDKNVLLTCTQGSYILYASMANFTNNRFEVDDVGILSFYSDTCIMHNNTMNYGGVQLNGFTLQHWNTHTIDVSNTVNGRPIRYYKNKNDLTVELNAAQVILANCNGVDLVGQNISGVKPGIEIAYTSNANIYGNTLSHCGLGVSCDNSTLNTIYHNNFISNSHNAWSNTPNTWDNGPSSGGNYWSNYVGVDANHDGFGDTNYSISNTSWQNVDRYPLMAQYTHPFNLSPPAIVLVSPLNGSALRPGRPIDVSILGANVSSVVLSVDGGAFSGFPAPYNVSTTSWTEGFHNVTVIANNTFSLSSKAKFTFVVDIVAPDIALRSPANNTDVRTGNLIDLDISDPHIALVNYSRAAGASAPRYNLSAPYDINTAGWPDGPVTVTARAGDSAGNSMVRTFSFEMDGTKPYVVEVAPENLETNVEPGVSVRIKFSEPMNASAVQGAISVWPVRTISVFSWNDDNTEVTFQFLSNLSFNTNYTIAVSLGAVDLVGNPLNASFSWKFLIWTDTDRDGLPNFRDPDDDNDGVTDAMDAFPLNPDESVDTDKDGIGDNADLDDDNDGIVDVDDDFPTDPYETKDTDGDGVGDNQDAFPQDASESVDSDGDGVGDNEDFLPQFNNNIFYLIVILVPCATAIIITYIVMRRRGGKGHREEPGKEEPPQSPEEDEAPVMDPMAPPAKEQ